MTLQITNRAIMQVFAFLALISMIAGTLPTTASATAVEPVCSVTVTSQDGDPGAVATFVHAAWTSISGATWIWSDALVTDTTIDQTKTFTKTFVWSGSVVNANLELASDNAYDVTLNGSSVGSATTATDNHSSTDSYNVASFIQEGVNTLSFSVTNLATPEDTDPHNNPAGLIYKMIANGSSTTCSEMPKTSVGGQKWNDTDGDGYWDEGEYGQDGVTITITDGEEFSATTVTSDGGYYSFGNLPTGVSYTICEVIPSGAEQTYPYVREKMRSMISCEGNGNGYQVTPSGEGSYELDFGNHEIDMYEIYGFVWDDSDKDDVMETEPVLEGWTVRATNVEDGSQVYTDVTDANGKYVIAVPAGTWRITEDVKSHWDLLSVADGDGSYTVTVPFHVDPEVSMAFPLSLFVTVAEAAVMPEYVGPKNFGNDYNGDGHSSGSKRKTPTTTTTTGGSTPTGQVLGAATTTLPVGAPKTGAGSTSPVAPTLPTLTAILTTGVTRRTK